MIHRLTQDISGTAHVSRSSSWSPAKALGLETGEKNAPGAAPDTQRPARGKTPGSWSEPPTGRLLCCRGACKGRPQPENQTVFSVTENLQGLHSRCTEGAQHRAGCIENPQ